MHLLNSLLNLLLLLQLILYREATKKAVGGRKGRKIKKEKEAAVPTRRSSRMSVSGKSKKA